MLAHRHCDGVDIMVCLKEKLKTAEMEENSYSKYSFLWPLPPKKKSTVKPLYSEQSRDPKKCSLYGGVHPRGVRHVHAHMCLKYNVHILKLTSQISLAVDF